MKNIVKKLFCRHDYKILRWHWTHGAMGNDPLFMEVHVKCKRCGKEKYIYPGRNSELEEYIVHNVPQEQRQKGAKHEAD